MACLLPGPIISMESNGSRHLWRVLISFLMSLLLLKLTDASIQPLQPIPHQAISNTEKTSFSQERKVVGNFKISNVNHRLIGQMLKVVLGAWKILSQFQIQTEENTQCLLGTKKLKNGN